MHIGVPLETQTGETRVAATPETIKKLIGQGHKVTVQSGAGISARAKTMTCRGMPRTCSKQNAGIRKKQGYRRAIAMARLGRYSRNAICAAIGCSLYSAERATMSKVRLIN